MFVIPAPHRYIKPGRGKRLLTKDPNILYLTPRPLLVPPSPPLSHFTPYIPFTRYSPFVYSFTDSIIEIVNHFFFTFT